MLLLSCTPARTAPTVNNPGLILQDIYTPPPEPDPPLTVTFEFQWIRDWDTPYYISGSEIRTLLITDCARYGISDEFFIWCLSHVPKSQMVTVQIPKPIRL